MEIAGTSAPTSSLEAASDLRDQTGLTILFFHVAGLADASPGIGGSAPVRGCNRVRSSWPKISVLSQRDTYACQSQRASRPCAGPQGGPSLHRSFGADLAQ